jgi:hypothetical protein
MKIKFINTNIKKEIHSLSDILLDYTLKTIMEEEDKIWFEQWERLATELPIEN